MSAERDVGRRLRLAQALAQGCNVSQAARVAGYSRMQVHRLVKDPEFQAEVERLRVAPAGPVAAVADHPEVVAARAVLRAIAEDPEAKAADRVAAAKGLIQAHQARVAKPTGVAPSEPKEAVAPLSPEEAAKQLGLRVV